jgi:type IV pilus assembly protein PilN
MIRINLLPTKEKAEAASQRQELTLFVLAFVLLAGTCLLLAVSQARRAMALDREIASLETRLKELEPVVKDVANLEQKRKDLDAKLQVIAELGHKRVGPAEALKDLGGATPERAWLTDFTELNGAATLTGQAVDNQTIAQFLRDLEGSEFFQNVDLVETTQADLKATGGDVRLRKFIVKATVNYAATRQQAQKAAPKPGAPG